MGGDELRLNELWKNIIAGNAGISERQFLQREIQDFMASKGRKDILNGRRYYLGDHDILKKRRTAIAENGVQIDLPNLVLGNLYQDYGRLEDTLNTQPSSPTAQVDWPRVHQRLEALHENSLFPHYIELYYATLAPISRDNLPDKLRITARALRFSPVDRLVFKYPVLLALAGQQRDAELMLRMAMRLYPDQVAGIRPQWQALSLRYPELQTLLPILNEKLPAPRG